jgi:hypothetical protein
MNIEFHYYTIYILAVEAGFDADSAQLLAEASQYIDDAKQEMVFESSRETIIIPATQNYIFWNPSVQSDIYLPFHFLPGDPEKIRQARLDDTLNPYSVSPNSELAKELLIKALNSGNLYRLGIALHAFADSWAHQNFSGRNEDWNQLGDAARLKETTGWGLPAAGHLQALTAPDEPDGYWYDPRLKPEYSRIINRQRFRQAAGKIYRYLSIKCGRQWQNEELLLDKLEKIWQSVFKEERLADYVIGWQMPQWEPAAWQMEAGVPAELVTGRSTTGYDKLTWLKNQLHAGLGINQPDKRIAVSTRFYESKLYHWNLAAREHRTVAQQLIKQKGLT